MGVSSHGMVYPVSALPPSFSPSPLFSFPLLTLVFFPLRGMVSEQTDQRRRNNEKHRNGWGENTYNEKANKRRGRQIPPQRLHRPTHLSVLLLCVRFRCSPLSCVPHPPHACRARKGKQTLTACTAPSQKEKQKREEERETKGEKR